MNRLRSATSPYLLQHADNPVHWWEWEPAAFEEARRRDVVLLSVGYAACHWCRVRDRSLRILLDSVKPQPIRGTISVRMGSVEIAV